ncbi:Penicillin acylase 2 precursor [Posidoniimonas corsicana]|uniref:Penicillin acylase 2 n=1 Tax=Posidoniimonas corsicana TaxID=1938618 RepID=A0A5C5VGH6_9BACT|nr:penicillin acylase family protein [Posidoniimonas corsicana]TWT37754.1 Penicillin acylase 2 precursor [Posidoniimonas corsicana]
MQPRRCYCCLLLAVFFLAPAARADSVEVLRDPWGVPHVFAETDAGAFYGLGYATAEDRAFQMTYALRTVQGRLAEVVGEVKSLRRRDTSIDHDRKMRTFGFHRAAQRTAAGLDGESRSLLEAYSRGVNDWFVQNADNLPALFAATGVEHEPWTPADCLASWWHVGQFFATDGTRDLIAGRNRGRAFPQPEDLERMPPDDSPAVVQKSDVSDEWLSGVQQYAVEQGLTPGPPGAPGPKFSHAWVVGGAKTTTGSAVLVSDPQTPVRNPSLFYEFHIQGKTFNARGMGVAGSPVILIGFSTNVAWGMTALGADQADLFLLETDPDHPNRYRLDGRWQPMTVLQEEIKVRDADPINYQVRETELGPVATEFCYARPADGEVALSRVPMAEPNRETIQGALAMIRAEDAGQFDAALEGWRFPTANVVFGDRGGDIGYRALGALPLRSAHDPSHGRKAHPARDSDDLWRGMLPHGVKPSVLNPASGFLYSGNHRPIGSWYPIPIGAMTGMGGDTVRSWRLRERLVAQDRFTADEVLDIHYDSVNPARRDIVRLGLHLGKTEPEALSDASLMTLGVLVPWLDRGASMSLDREGAALALELGTFFRFVNTELAFQYGGGESGLAYFLKSATSRVAESPDTRLNRREREFLDAALESAWVACLEKYGPDPDAWSELARQAVTSRKLGYYEGLDGFPELDRQHALNLPPLDVIDGGTIACQTAQSYTQWAPMHDPDLAMSILPIGQSERPGDESRLSTLRLWSEGKLHPAPLSRDKVEALGVTRTELRYPR